MEEETRSDTLSQESGEEVTVESLTARLEEVETAKRKAEENYENQKTRAEKAESKNKTEDKPAPNKEASEEQNLTSKDMLALMGSKITETEDVDYLQTVAKGFGMTITDALKDPTIKAKLEERQEERATAQATNTKGGAKGNSKVSADSILREASKGKLPESDDDMSKLVKARLDSKRK